MPCGPTQVMHGCPTLGLSACVQAAQCRDPLQHPVIPGLVLNPMGCRRKRSLQRQSCIQQQVSTAILMYPCSVYRISDHKAQTPREVTGDISTQLTKTQIATRTGSPDLRTSETVLKPQQLIASTESSQHDDGKIKAVNVRPGLASDDAPMSPSSVKRVGYWMGTSGAPAGP